MRPLLLSAAPLLLAAGIGTLRAQTLPVGGTSFDVDLYGNVYVLDAGKNTLRLYDRGGTLRKDVGGPGWADGQFDRPAAVWARNGIDVYVADFGNHRIERFDRSLNFVSSFSTRDNGNPDERFGYPSGVALSRLGELFICDTENGQIVKVDRFSTVERTFGGITAGKGHLATPSAVATGPKDAVYVLDGNRVAVFDAFGNYLRDLLPGVLAHPEALYADDGVVAVLDSMTIFFCDADERPAGVFAARGAVPPGAVVRSFLIARDSLYLLTGDEIVRVADPRRASGLENQSISH
ncbi:MAG TPA: NHL repeat-containing protein [Bacteroidota bacterium]|nr:NHL repeat-containing protein [Bacteroidota bacterium]